MTILKSEQHHWWPKAVSKHWAGDDGRTGWLRSDGSVKRLKPNQLGMIGNAHIIKFGKTYDEPTDWDQNFESYFDSADSNFPNIINWLKSLPAPLSIPTELKDRFEKQEATDVQIQNLVECVVSLAVRAPRNREASVSLAERLRGPLPTQERNTLIGINMRDSQRVITEAFGIRGKYAVLVSKSKEFIYGDGFFHNVSVTSNLTHAAKFLVPITPYLCVMMYRPMSHRPEPRFSSAILTEDEVDLCNRAVQVYSRDSLFYRKDRPVIMEDFMCKQHRIYTDHPLPLDYFFDAMPGVIAKKIYSPN